METMQSLHKKKISQDEFEMPDFDDEPYENKKPSRAEMRAFMGSNTYSDTA